MNKHLDVGNGTPGSNSTALMTIDVADIDALYQLAKISRVLKNATCAIEKLAQLATGASDLTLMHCLALIHLSRSSSCKQADLKAAMGINPAHLTKLLDKLVHRNLVSRYRSAWDRRQIILALTSSGWEIARCLVAALHDLIGNAQISAIEQLGSSLERFVSTTEGGDCFKP